MTALATLPDLLGTSPADLLGDCECRDSTPDEARQRAERLRGGIVGYAQMRQDIADAFAGRDWLALGYDSWATYVEGEFGELLAQLGRGERRQAVADLRGQGMSTRQIADATGIGQTQVRRDLAEVSPDGSPATVTGSDGKQHPATRPTPKPDLKPTILRVLGEAGPDGLTAAQIGWPDDSSLDELRAALLELVNAGRVLVVGHRPAGAPIWALTELVGAAVTPGPVDTTTSPADPGATPAPAVESPVLTEPREPDPAPTEALIAAVLEALDGHGQLGRSVAEIWTKTPPRTPSSMVQLAVDELVRRGRVAAGPVIRGTARWLLTPNPAPEHYETRGWKGDEPGSCGVECACGVGFDGFDSLAEAQALLAGHIETPEPAEPLCQNDPETAAEYAEMLAAIPGILADGALSLTEIRWRCPGTPPPSSVELALRGLEEAGQVEPAGRALRGNRMESLWQLAEETPEPVDVPSTAPAGPGSGEEVVPAREGAGAASKPPPPQALRIEPTEDEKRAAVQRDARRLLLRVVEILDPAHDRPGFVGTWARQLGPYDEELSGLIHRAHNAMASLDDLISEAGQAINRGGAA